MLYQGKGSSIAAYGLMAAHDQNAANVAYATTLDDALSDYTEILARGGGHDGISGVGRFTPFKGQIWRVGLKEAGVWQFQMFGDKRYYDVSGATFTGAPNLRDGDKVEGSFLDTGRQPSRVHVLKLLDAPEGLAEPLPAARDESVEAPAAAAPVPAPKQ